MTNLDYIVTMIYHEEAKEQLDQILGGIWELDKLFPDFANKEHKEEKVEVPISIIKEILEAYGKLVS